jgi:hypothetical protein
MVNEIDIKQTYYADGQLQSERSYRRGIPHGWHREWHANGIMASEVCLRDGVPDGVGRQWDVEGNLILSYEIHDGTGVQKLWFEEQGIGGEMPWVGGKLTGRQRTFYRDGTTCAYTYWIANKKVSRKRYDEECQRDAGLPKYETQDEPSFVNPSMRVSSADTDDLARAILARQGAHEALSWLKDDSTPECSLGEASTINDSIALVESLYRAGAVRVWVFDVRGSGAVGQNSGRLLVELPNDAKPRQMLLSECSKIGAEQGFSAEVDYDQQYVVLMLD